MEPHFPPPGPEASSGWIFSTKTPSLADITLYYQLSWAADIAAGRGIHNLTGGGTPDTDTEGATAVFNKERYPGVLGWFSAFAAYMDGLPSTETRVKGDENREVEGVVRLLEG